VLVKPSKVSFLSEQQTLDAIQSGMLLDPSKIATMSLGPAQQNPKDVEGEGGYMIVSYAPLCVEKVNRGGLGLFVLGSIYFVEWKV
jgi:hypothetical protein